MEVKLKNIADITTGIYYKGGISGSTYYLQARHFDQAGKFRKDPITGSKIQLENKLEKHILQDKDLLVTAKGMDNKVCIYEREIGIAVASSTFFVMRLRKSSIIPEYLQWYLNTDRMQFYFSTLSKGTRIHSLSKKALMDIKVAIPSLAQQEEVLKIQRLWDMEQKATLELLELKAKLYQNLQLNLATEKLNNK